MRRAPSMLALVLLSGALGGCLGGPSALEERADAYGDLDDEGPEHLPGEPCLVCHSEESSRGEEIFAIAGTVYRRATDDEGLEGAVVTITDARGWSFEVETNRAGNFMVEAEREDPERPRVRPHEDGRGQVKLNYWPLFPLTASVRHGDVEQDMLTLIHREGSCSECHTRASGASSVGRVYLEE